MTFFDYGCCVSTSQTLWVLIFSFVFAILVVVACCMSSVFVRWVYRRRLRKKVEALKDKYRQDDREKREKQFQLDLIAKRPIVPQNRNPAKETNQFVDKTTIFHQYLPTPLKDKMTTETVSTFPAVPVTLSQTTLDPLTEMGKTSVLMDTKTMAGVVHELAKNSACKKRNQPPFPGVDIQSNTSLDESFVKGTTVEDVTQLNSVEIGDSTKLAKTVEKPKKDHEGFQIDKTQTDEDEEPRKKSGLTKVFLGASADFPYYSGRLGSNKSLRSKRSSTASLMSYGTTQGKNTESVASVAKETSPKPNKMQYNVYELRRIAEEQTKVVETEEACELIRNRQPERKKHDIETAALSKKMAQLQKVKNINDSPSFKDQK